MLGEDRLKSEACPQDDEHSVFGDGEAAQRNSTIG